MNVLNKDDLNLQHGQRWKILDHVSGFWAAEHVHQFHEKGRHRGESDCVGHHVEPQLWTIFLTQYMQVLQTDFTLQLTTTQLPMDAHWFLQVGSLQHVTNIMSDFLHTVFRHHAILHQYLQPHKCGHIWPPLNPCKFFILGFHER